MNWFATRCAFRREDLCLLASGALTPDEQADLKAHVAGCDECRRYFEEVQRAAAPFVNWEKHFTHVQPDPGFEQRWKNAVRAAASPKPAREPEPTGGWAGLWLELVCRPRWVWAGFAAVWVAILAANLSDADIASAAVAKLTPTPASLSLAWAQQQKLMTELIDPDSHDADKPKPSRPRSQGRSEWQRG